MTYRIVWFKRDLRLHDHIALHTAASQGPVLCLYVVEPSIWAQPDAANQHYQFLLESLRDLYVALRQRGGQLHILTGEVTSVFDQLFASAPFSAIYSHEETGNDATYQRDKAVGRWCRAHQIAWHEFAQFGVVRRLQDRDGWQRQWNAHNDLPCVPVPELTAANFAALPPLLAMPQLPASPQELGLDAYDPPQRQRGGRQCGLSMLNSFLTDRSNQYRGGISSPLSAPTACSRLSPYLAFGCVSLREIVHATRRQVASLSPLSPLSPGTSRQKQGLNAFVSRLYWHCHFIQKLESEPQLEYRNLHRGYDGLREHDWNQAHFEALTSARTGWPLVDACVTMLHQTGWLNFRMRAMLVSVAAYPLWLDWRPVGHWLARQFLDYEPGIHWSQMQMQSGTTGINVPRIYNPIKQASDHDPHGRFVRRWLPAMRRVPDSWLFEPWRMPPDVQAACGVQVGVDIAMPVVDIDLATREAKARLFALRAQPGVKSAKAAIVEKHGSRKKDIGRTRRKSAANAAQQNSQLDLGF
ncbi:FAD-binding domain-containing protein [Undibacterium sp. 5I1]|uniref:FAD-binding domain-containing protein n=1 Tax=unclassified Undibacterium TaxID=2630295 RepID=UPI002AB4830A|nr:MULTISPECIES: FAD-binding domain-containing protein [unclassified Undibacterium]MDY7540444.1 FAD-binding domain-containing protein [Undibacterium sp. 5I1]MEB0230095.1 FAD-binding domain-containing protein [Undibacterium sp. 10I3]MEB0257703.1 FAD-binding domain-containing protein [Undibacterium sp. 5I1]